MANKSIFKSASTPTKSAKATDTVNNAGGRAYSLSDKSALAQLTVTGTFNDTFYAPGTAQIDTLLSILPKVDPTFIAKLSIYARENGKMKDTPTALLAYLASTDRGLFWKAFDRVCDNGKQVRNFVQMIRSGKFGRKSFGTSIKRAVRQWIEKRSDERLLNDTVGNSPSLADVIRLVRPVPKNKTREAFYAWILGRKVVMHADEMTYRIVGEARIPETVLYSTLPENVRAYEDFKTGRTSVIPKVDFRLVTAKELTSEQWSQIASNSDFNMIRQNLNTFARHNVLTDKSIVKTLASKLSNRETVKRVKLFPYQLLTTFQNIEDSIPNEIKNALQDAMEVATENVPAFEGAVYVFPDVSGSMSSPATGRSDAPTKTRCIDIAGLVASSLMRTCKDCTVTPFDTRLHSTAGLNSRDSVMTNATKLGGFGGGGTEVGLPMADLANNKKEVSLVIYISDNESWYESNPTSSWRTSKTDLVKYWDQVKSRNPKAKMVCIDIQANATTQAKDSNSVLNIGGFSDSIWETIANFVNGDIGGKDAWVQDIEKVEL